MIEIPGADAAPIFDHILAPGLAFWQSKALPSAVALGPFTAPAKWRAACALRCCWAGW
jgi:hypothetical protein